MADRASFPSPLPYQPNSTTSAETETNARFDNLLSPNGANYVSPGLAGGDDVATLPPVAVERRTSVAPPANPRSNAAPISPYAMGLLVGTMGPAGAAAAAVYGEDARGSLNAMGDEVESWHLGTRVFGALGLIGGGAETVAGGATLVAGTGASEVLVGVPVAVLGGTMIFHGIDTAWAGAQSAWTGETVETHTVRALIGAGLPPLAANLTDAGIGIAFSLGSSALMKSPRIVSAAVADSAMAAEAAENTKNLAAATLQQQSGGRIAIGLADGGHVKVMVQEAGAAPQWSHLVSDWGTRRITVKYTHAPGSETYAVVELPVSAERATAAATAVRDMMDSQSVLGSQVYRLGQADCIVYGAEVLAAGKIATPLTPRSAYLLQEVQRDVDLLLASADETRGVAARLAEAGANNVDEAKKLKRAADDLQARAVRLMDEYIGARSGNVFDAATAQQPRLQELERVYKLALDEATQTYLTAQAVLNTAYAAHAAKAENVQIAATIATGAHAAQAGEDIPLSHLDPNTIIQTVTGQGDSGGG